MQFTTHFTQEQIAAIQKLIDEWRAEARRCDATRHVMQCTADKAIFEQLYGAYTLCSSKLEGLLNQSISQNSTVS